MFTQATGGPRPTPSRGSRVVAAGMAINLCLGILYAWSVWKASLIATPDHPAGSAMTGINAGWEYLTNAQATWAYAACGLTFALFMIPGGLAQDRFGAKFGATLGGLLLGLGCVVAGLLKSYVGLIIGFGLLGGMGMGLGYAAATPAAVKWFGPQRRGLVVGLVVGGYGAAAVYISPLARYLIDHYGISGSFIGLGVLFAVVITLAAQLLVPPPEGHELAAAPAAATARMGAAGAPSMSATHWTGASMLRTWQYYAMVFLFLGSAQAGLLVIANAAPILNSTAKSVPMLAANAWLLASFGGIVNAAGRVVTGFYSDKIGRRGAYLVNGLAATVGLLLTPMIMRSGNVTLLFIAVGLAYWQYGGGLSLMPAMTADYFGARDLGFKYGLVFLGWGVAFLIPQIAGYIEDVTGNLDGAFYMSAGFLLAAIVLSRFLERPLAAGEMQPAA